MDAWVEVSRPDGTLERHRIEGEQATLGRSPTAGIPLVNADDLQPEHMLLAPRPDGCWVAIAQGAKPPAIFHGKPLSAAVVPWGSEIEVGSVRIRVTDKLSPIKQDGKSVSSPIMVIMFVAIPLVGWMLLSDPEVSLPVAPDNPPELFDETAGCPAQGAPLHNAVEAAEAASHRSERYPFDAQDGIGAVGLYDVAQACFERAERGADARRMARERRVLARRINEDYRTHRLRLERALKFERFDDGLRESHALNALLVHKRGDVYVTWLILLERRLQLIMDQQLAAEEP